MIRYQGHSMPGFGVGVVATVLTFLVAPALSIDMRLWQVGAIGLAVWIVVDVACIVSLRRKGDSSQLMGGN